MSFLKPGKERINIWLSCVTLSDQTYACSHSYRWFTWIQFLLTIDCSIIYNLTPAIMKLFKHLVTSHKLRTAVAHFHLTPFFTKTTCSILLYNLKEYYLTRQREFFNASLVIKLFFSRSYKFSIKVWSYEPFLFSILYCSISEHSEKLSIYQ